MQPPLVATVAFGHAFVTLAGFRSRSRSLGFTQLFRVIDQKPHILSPKALLHLAHLLPLQVCGQGYLLSCQTPRPTPRHSYNSLTHQSGLYTRTTAVTIVQSFHLTPPGPNWTTREFFSGVWMSECLTHAHRTSMLKVHCVASPIFNIDQWVQQYSVFSILTLPKTNMDPG